MRGTSEVKGAFEHWPAKGRMHPQTAACGFRTLSHPRLAPAQADTAPKPTQPNLHPRCPQQQPRQSLQRQRSGAGGAGGRIRLQQAGEGETAALGSGSGSPAAVEAATGAAGGPAQPPLLLTRPLLAVRQAAGSQQQGQEECDPHLWPACRIRVQRQWQERRTSSHATQPLGSMNRSHRWARRQLCAQAVAQRVGSPCHRDTHPFFSPMLPPDAREMSRTASGTRGDGRAGGAGERAQRRQRLGRPSGWQLPPGGWSFLQRAFTSSTHTTYSTDMKMDAMRIGRPPELAVVQGTRRQTRRAFDRRYHRRQLALPPECSSLPGLGPG